jgi:CRISPR-associated endonuclease/helicase Cas3
MPSTDKITAFSEIFSHPGIPYDTHIEGMILESDTVLEQFVKRCHDLFKLRQNFQSYIRDTKNYKGGEKSHAPLSAWLFLSQSTTFEPLERIIGFLAISRHHGELIDCKVVIDNVALGFNDSQAQAAITEVKDALAQIVSYPFEDIPETLIVTKPLTGRAISNLKKHLGKLGYNDYTYARSVIANLFACDKQEAIFHQQPVTVAPSGTLIDRYMQEYATDSSESSQKRRRFQQTVLENYRKDEKLFTISAPTGYGKTLAAFKLAAVIPAKRWIFALPFTSIVDQTYEIAKAIFEPEHTVFRFHHKTVIDEEDDMQRYSEAKFLMESFNADITVTTTYQMIYTFFGKENMETVRFHALRDAVVILDEVQSIPHDLRKDFFALCESISKQLRTTFVLMSATMPKSRENFIELSDSNYFSEQNRYQIDWFGDKDKGSEDALQAAIHIHSENRQSCMVVFNQIATCQSFFQTCFTDERIVYNHILCLNGYMIGSHAKATIEQAKTALAKGETVLFISTQSIEAGVDLSFDVGYREIAPVPSIIQTAGRINRHFGTQGILYVFGVVSEYTNSIYGDLQLVSNFFHTKLQNGLIDEKDILQDAQTFFSSMHEDVERTVLEKPINELAFETLAEQLDKIMHGDEFGKEAIFIETYAGEAKALEHELQERLKEAKNASKFDINNIFEIIFKKASVNLLNVSKNDFEAIQTTLNMIDMLKIPYLPFGALEYNWQYGFKKKSALKKEINVFD